MLHQLTPTPSAALRLLCSLTLGWCVACNAGSTAADPTDFNQPLPHQSPQHDEMPTVMPTPTVTPASPTPASPTPTDTPVYNCNTTLFMVCDGFETAALGSPPDANRWNSTVSLPPPGDNGVHSEHAQLNHIVVTDAMAHNGNQSLLFHTVGGWEHVPIQDVTSARFPNAFLPAPNNTFYVRYWVYIHAPNFSNVGGGHYYMVNASGPLAGRQQYQKFGGNGATLSWNYWGNDEGVGSSTPWPRAMWTCVEVGFKGDTHELFVWLNDSAVADMNAQTNAWAAPAYDRLTLGWEMDHPDSSYDGADVYMDDIAYSYHRIHCVD